jgi:NlpC/P60 family putative phage cell wall peptidase
MTITTNEPRSRSLIIKTALTWLDTPYQHQASVKASGCDCLGLIRGVWRELYGSEPVELPPYNIDWAETGGEETLLNAAQTYLSPIAKTHAQPGDVLMFRMQPQAMCKHVAILMSPNSMLHAYWGRAVVESALIPYWRRRWVYSFSFPDMDV